MGWITHPFVLERLFLFCIALVFDESESIELSPEGEENSLKYLLYFVAKKKCSRHKRASLPWLLSTSGI